MGLIVALATNVLAFGTDMHQTLNDRGALASTLDNYVREQLGFTRGLAETINGRPIREWIQRGGEAEDEFLRNELLGAAFRSIHHFHNPLLPWQRAGLDALSPCPPFLLQGEASVRWAQHPDQGISGKASWGNARASFYQGLTLFSKAGGAGRDTALARTFQILGQQMHLIADLAVPAHTRNDPHCPSPDGFEAWASRRDNQLFIQGLIAGQPVRPDPAIFTIGVPIQDDLAKVAVARLWDTDQYDKTNPDVTLSPTIGLAEYTSANFLSDDTAFSLELPFPARTSVELLDPPEPEAKTGELRRYFRKVRDGELIDHLAVPSALYEFLPDALKDKKIGFDDKVFEDYAKKLLPRAVGYSVSLLDYFFRGRLETHVDSSTSIRIVNLTPSETLNGTFALYYDTADGTRVPLTSWTLALAPGETSGVLPSASLPTNLPQETRCLLVFQGRLVTQNGLAEEANAVAGQIGDCPRASADLPPPPPSPGPPPAPLPCANFCCILVPDVGWVTPPTGAQASLAACQLEGGVWGNQYPDFTCPPSPPCGADAVP